MESVSTNCKIPVLKEKIFNRTISAIEEFKREQDTNSETFFETFPYSFFDEDNENDRKELEELCKILLESNFGKISEINLRIANHNLSNYDEVEKTRLVRDYIDDFLNYVIPRIINLQDWQEGLDKYYRLFEEEHLSDEFEVKFFGRIVNFGYSFAGTGLLSNNTKIEVLSSSYSSSENRAYYFRVKKAFRYAYPTPQKTFEHLEYFVIHTRRFPKTEKNTTERFSAYEFLRKFMLAVRCLERGGAYIDFVTAFFLGNRCSTVGESATFPEHEFTLEQSRWTQIEYPQDVWLQRLWSKLEFMDYGKVAAIEHKLEDSLRRNIRGYNTWNVLPKTVDQLERLSDLFTALDGVYQTRHGETKRLVALYTAHLVTLRNKSWHFDEVRSFVEKMYDIRSDYEHGRLEDALKSAGKLEDFQKQVDVLEWHVKWVITLFILNDDFRSRLGGNTGIGSGNLSGIKTI